MNNDNLAEFRECSVCLCSYNQQNADLVPRQLPCQHSYCTKCLRELQKLVAGTSTFTIDCPTCRVKHTFNRNTEIPKNRLIIAYLETINPTTNANNQSSRTSTTNSNSYTPAKTNPPHPTPQTTSQRTQVWSLDTFLREIFDDIDKSGDGQIELNELEQALIRGQPDSKFDIKTVRFLLEKYDTDRDGCISFKEFRDLFLYLNDEYEKFLMIDYDFSGSIDANELKNGLKQRCKQQLSSSFYDFIVNSFRTRHIHSITFDHFLRLTARFDYLCALYMRGEKLQSLEDFLKARLFDDFW